MSDTGTNGQGRVALVSSERKPVPGSRRVGDAVSDERVLVTVIVRRRPGPGFSLEQPPANRADRPAWRSQQRARFAEQGGAGPEISRPWPRGHELPALKWFHRKRLGDRSRWKARLLKPKPLLGCRSVSTKRAGSPTGAERVRSTSPLTSHPG